MSRNLSNSLIEAVLSQETKEVYLFLLTISSGQLDDDIYFANNYSNIISNGETFLGFPFTVSLPDEQESQLPAVQISIDNVAQEIIDEVRTITEYPNVQLDIILASDPDTIEDSYTLSLRNVNWDLMVITGTLQGQDILNQKYGEQFTPQNAPGIFP